MFQLSGEFVRREAYGLRCLRDSVFVESLRAAYRDAGAISLKENRRSRQMRDQSRLIATPIGP